MLPSSQLKELILLHIFLKNITIPFSSQYFPPLSILNLVSIWNFEKLVDIRSKNLDIATGLQSCKEECNVCSGKNF